MVQQHVALPQQDSNSAGIPRVAPAIRAGRERLEFQVRPRRLVVQIEKPRKIDRPVAPENLPAAQPEIRSQPLDNFRTSAPASISSRTAAPLPPPVQLRVHRIQNAARFLLAQIEVAVARDAERRGGKNLVAVERSLGVRVHDVVQKCELDFALSPRAAADSRGSARGTVTTPR